MYLQKLIYKSFHEAIILQSLITYYNNYYIVVKENTYLLLFHELVVEFHFCKIVSMMPENIA